MMMVVLGIRTKASGSTEVTVAGLSDFVNPTKAVEAGRSNCMGQNFVDFKAFSLIQPPMQMRTAMREWIINHGCNAENAELAVQQVGAAVGKMLGIKVEKPPQAESN